MPKPNPRIIEKKEVAQRLKTHTQELEESQKAALNILEDLAVEKAKVEAILSSIGEGIIATDLDRRIIVMNKTAERLLGWKIKEAIGKLYDEIIFLEDERGTFIPLIERPLHRAFSSGATTTTAGLYLISKNKIKFPVAITVSPVVLGDKIIGAVEVFRDITKEREIDKEKSEFVSLASHQLRTPLTAISWYSEMMLKGDVGQVIPEQRKYLEEISNGNQRMIQLVNTLLDVSRLDLGTFQVALSPTDVVALTHSVVDEQKLKIAEKKIELSETFSTEMPRFSTDPKLLRMVLQNILSNAVEYTPTNGTVRLDVGFDEAKKNITISIADTGYGIPKHQQRNIFTKFFRADNVRDKVSSGTGLGLYIVKSVVERFGGKIWFESEENKGTTFHIVLPLDGIKKR